jgi:hypothetical protein
MLTTSQKEFIHLVAKGTPSPVNSGHMLYVRSLIDSEDSPWFVKAHDADLFTHDKKRDEALRYLRKEYAVYQHLRGQKFNHIPNQHHYQDGVLLLSGLTKTRGWHWRIPGASDAQTYIRSVLDTLDTLQTISTHKMFDSESSVDFFWQNGWGSNESVASSISAHSHNWHDVLRPNTQHALAQLAKSIHEVKLRDKPIISEHISHHDIRQSNLAWHPKHGTVIVDWSWASHGVHNADSTMFLIDLHKSGVDVSSFLVHYFNDQYAKLLIGYWLLRLGEPTASGNDEVRLHQLVSALSAFELLNAK